MLRDLYYRVLYVFQGQKLIFQRGAAAAPVQIGTQDRGGSRSVARPEDDVVRARIAESRAKRQAAAERNRQRAAEAKRLREEASAG